MKLKQNYLYRIYYINQPSKASEASIFHSLDQCNRRAAEVTIIKKLSTIKCLKSSARGIIEVITWNLPEGPEKNHAIRKSRQQR